MLEAAHELGILYGMIGSIQGLGGPPPGLTTRASPYRALWVACEFAVAPLPALWKARWQRGETADHPLRVVYEKTEQGHVTERDEHPLLHAYQSIAARFIPHCPRASIKTSPQCAYMLFSVDGMPRCIDMRHAAKRFYKLRKTAASASSSGTAAPTLAGALRRGASISKLSSADSRDLMTLTKAAKLSEGAASRSAPSQPRRLALLVCAAAAH